MRSWMMPLVVAALSVPLPAFAVDFGTSIGLGVEYSENGSAGLRNLPTLDLRFPSFIVQVHVLETLLALGGETVVLGANAYLPLLENRELAGPVEVAVQPGLSVDVAAGNVPFTINLGATARFGVEVAGDVGAGLYIVPVVGVSLLDGDAGLFGGGVLEASVWF
jgi:hypothetical protein